MDGADCSTCPIGRILRENGKKLYPGASVGVNQYLVGVFDSISLLSGFIDPNAKVFKIFNSDKPVFINDYVESSDDESVGTQEDLGEPVLTYGNIISSEGFVGIHSTIQDATAYAGAYLWNDDSIGSNGVPIVEAGVNYNSIDCANQYELQSTFATLYPDGKIESINRSEPLGDDFTRVTLTANGNVFNTGNTSTLGLVNFSYSGSADSVLSITGSDTKGGVGYHDFLRVTNTNAATEGPEFTKWFRLDLSGELQIVNDDYSTVLLTLNDSGKLNHSGLSDTLIVKRSAFVDAGSAVTLENLSVRLPPLGGYNSLQVTTDNSGVSYNVLGTDVYIAGGSVGGSAINQSPGNALTIDESWQYLNGNLDFNTAGDTDTWTIMDNGNNIAWRISLVVGYSYLNNLITIERLL